MVNIYIAIKTIFVLHVLVSQFNTEFEILGRGDRLRPYGEGSQWLGCWDSRSWAHHKDTSQVAMWYRRGVFGFISLWPVWGQYSRTSYDIS